MAINITSDNFETEVMKASKPVILDVYATWCGPCQQMMPIVEELEKELGSKYIFAKLNVDEARDVSIHFSVTSVPTFIFIKDGQVKRKETGFMDKETLEDLIKESFE